MNNASSRSHCCGEQDGRVNGIAIGRWDWKAEKIQGWNRDESSESEDWNIGPGNNAKIQEVVNESRYAPSDICVVELGGKLDTDSGDRERKLVWNRIGEKKKEKQNRGEKRMGLSRNNTRARKTFERKSGESFLRDSRCSEMGERSKTETDGGDDDGDGTRMKRNPRREFDMRNFVGRSSRRDPKNLGARGLLNCRIRVTGVNFNSL